MTALPTGLTAGTYTADPTHTSATFTVRHAGISKVRGSLAVSTAVLTVGADIETSSVTATLDAASISTGNDDRDNHLKSADFWDVEKNPVWTFVSTSAAASGDDFAVTGDLTINGVTRSVVLTTEFVGIATDPYGNHRAGFEAKTEISRKDFGLTYNAALEAGGVLIGDTVKIAIDISAIKG
ncbi:YceI family protein [Sanguibacter antarcticus]|uniref:Polyisoprenoid-binding protein YceI n=1 Tax=Sanguibacter antarcticus TaxID=372484 RepID=A0A2A9E7D4_9MICO|nr:YceI family protein [Sanguibacter antarcticus]PFG34142.1 polyisoprenoid-binding protein YceI [Sanguibacter antarcticus]